MDRISRRSLGLSTVLLLSGLALVGCGRGEGEGDANPGTTAEVRMLESDPPVLTRAVADRIRPGMSQEDVLSLLRDAARGTGSALSSLKVISTQGRLNALRYDLTVTQGDRRLVLAFRKGALVEKHQDDFE